MIKISEGISTKSKIMEPLKRKFQGIIKAMENDIKEKCWK